MRAVTLDVQKANIEVLIDYRRKTGERQGETGREHEVQMNLDYDKPYCYKGLQTNFNLSCMKCLCQMLLQ